MPYMLLVVSQPLQPLWKFLPPQHMGVIHFPPIQFQKNSSCMIIAYHNSQNFAKLPDVLFMFCKGYQTDVSYRYPSTDLYGLIFERQMGPKDNSIQISSSFPVFGKIKSPGTVHDTILCICSILSGLDMICKYIRPLRIRWTSTKILLRRTIV